MFNTTAFGQKNLNTGATESFIIHRYGLFEVMEWPILLPELIFRENKTRE